MKVFAVITRDRPKIVRVARQGMPGPPGSAPTITPAAAIALGGHRVIVLNGDGEAIYADHSIVAHAGRAIGITTGAAEEGELVTVQTGGDITEPSWTWDTELPIFLSTNGQLTQTAPNTGFTQQIAVPVTATRILIDLQTPFIRG